ncbi:DUF692 domain-containing protein [Streptomyces sp. R302]|uniref:DUF692 domain-containing protein n=1 Tax=unclassified Streptomyces TaxID=2593676 RepID=UPI00145DE09A|nr:MULTISPECIES: DUF692 domain-containing protein [unclassified Streptomyces]NML51152.1 DUF692 domain-containing protein [Streptomyces sp. R301]NML79730.1 DUF692 domain-containing protein [Streptomyces sp. R302]
MTELGIGIGWRPEIADAVEELPGVDWVEVVAENVCADHLPDSLARLRARGVTVVPHGVSLGLGGADRPDPERLAALAAKAEALGAPLVTEHIAFVRAGGPLTATPRLEAGHLLPVPRTREALDVLCENVRIAQESLPVPLALENIAALFSWPDEELTEGRFLAELVERTGVRLLIDVANLHTNHVNRGEDPARALAELPVEALAYVHVAGGLERDGVWHDTHAHPVPQPVLDILADLAGRIAPPGVLLERDDHFPPATELAAELSTIRTTLTTAPRRRPAPTTEDAAAPQAADETAADTLTAGGAGDVHAARAAAGPLAARHGVGTAALRAGRALTGGAPLHIGAGARVSGGPMPSTHPGPTPTPTPTPTPITAADHAPAPSGGPVATLPRPDAETGTGPKPGTGTGTGTEAEGAVRQRVGVAQAAVLSALVAGTPVPEGFDVRRMRVQGRALAAKRASVVARIAPELPEILGDGFRPAFLAYARSRPLPGNYRRDALDFVERLLLEDRPERRELTRWWRERAESRPVGGFVGRLARRLLGGR